MGILKQIDWLIDWLNIIATHLEELNGKFAFSSSLENVPLVYNPSHDPPRSTVYRNFASKAGIDHIFFSILYFFFPSQAKSGINL